MRQIFKKTSGIKVYPDPVTNDAVVQFNSFKASDYSLEVTDVTGRVLEIKTGKVSTGENKIVINLSEYTPGMYMVSLSDTQHEKRMVKVSKE